MCNLSIYNWIQSLFQQRSHVIQKGWVHLSVIIEILDFEHIQFKGPLGYFEFLHVSLGYISLCCFGLL